MSYKKNALSIFGRMGYLPHLLFYPTALGAYIYGIKPWMDERSRKSEQDEWDKMPKAKPVDPDLFNPFTPIPYHNNPELTYVFAHINMHDYLNENHINVHDYVWRDYHNSYDHNNENGYLYDWTSMHEAIDSHKHDGHKHNDHEGDRHHDSAHH